MLASKQAGVRVSATRLQSVSLRFPARSQPVLDNIDCQIEAGQGVIIFGASGSGKSSLVQLLSGVIPHSINALLDGTVEVYGRDVSRLSVVELSRTVGMVAQDPQSQVCLARVEDEIALCLENHGTPVDDIDKAIDTTLEAVGAGELRMRDTATLSGGECQRVAVAAALVSSPKLLLLDEPTSMLDADGVSAVRAALGRAIDGIRPTTVLVEHRLDEIAGEYGAAGLPERAIVLDRNGRLVAQGVTTQLLSDHAALLRAGGCWLPLESELNALTGNTGGIKNPVNQGFLRGIVERSLVAFNVPAPVDAGEVRLRAENLSIGYDGRPSISNLSLELRAGTITTVVGRNGVGKSTLLRTLAGVAAPLSGTVEGDRAGLIFQNPEHQFVAPTVAAEVAVGIPSNVRGAERESRVESLLAEHRLGVLRGRSPWRLSGGEKRRLSIAAMLAHGRGVILADEPSYGLDRHDALAAMTAIRRAADNGAAVLIASHDVRCAAGISDLMMALDGDALHPPASRDAAAVLRESRGLADLGVRVPPLVRMFAEHSASAAQLQAMLNEFETMPECEE